MLHRAPSAIPRRDTPDEARPYLTGHIAAYASAPNSKTLYLAVAQAPNEFVTLGLSTFRLRDIGPAPGNA